MNIKVAVVIPNWNGKEDLDDCLRSLTSQTQSSHIIVVDNGSKDGSVEFLKSKYPNIELIEHKKNLGFDGGVNAGIKRAMIDGFEYIALLNNDAVVDINWLKNLVINMNTGTVGVVTCKIKSSDNSHIDSTGEFLTSWGLSFPRGRDEVDSGQYEKTEFVFGASGGASLYRSSMLKEIGLFDEDFFAYYEDVDISFRAQLAGWKVIYEPKAIAYHKIGATSGKIKGFTTYQTLKNLPFVLIKDVPVNLLPHILPRFLVAYLSFYVSAISRGQVVPATKGVFIGLLLTPKKLLQRITIQKSRKVGNDYIKSIIVWDLPPNALKLRRLRDRLRKGK